MHQIFYIFLAFEHLVCSLCIELLFIFSVGVLNFFVLGGRVFVVEFKMKLEF